MKLKQKIGSIISEKNWPVFLVIVVVSCFSFRGVSQNVHESHQELLKSNLSPYASPLVQDDDQSTDSSNVNLDSLYYWKNTTGYKNVPIDPGDIWASIDSAKENYEIFAWYPHWFPDYHEKFDFSKVNTVAYFSYEFDPKTGQKISSHDWLTTSMVDKAKAKDCKVLLTISSFEGFSNSIFLNNPDARAVLISNVIQEVKLRDADGLCIDFENVKYHDKKQFSSFIKDISAALRRYKSDGLVYLAVPSVDQSKSFDLAMNEEVDKAVIMAYGYAGAWSDPKPNAPVDGDGHSLTKTVDYYAQLIEPSKLLLGLPLYGCMWDVKEDSTGRIISDFEGYRTLSYINNNLVGPATIDSASKASYIEFQLATDMSTTRKIWFNNEVSFFYQIKLAKEKNLGGIGLWALGFEENCPMLWDVVTTSLVPPSDQMEDTLTVHVDSKIGWWEDFQVFVSDSYNSIHEYHSFILWVLSLIVMFGFFGFIISLFDARTREFFTSNAFLRRATIGIVLFCGILIVFFIDVGPHSNDADTENHNNVTDFFQEIYFIVGFLVGIVAIRLINWSIKRKKSRLP